MKDLKKSNGVYPSDLLWFDHHQEMLSNDDDDYEDDYYDGDDDEDDDENLKDLKMDRTDIPDVPISYFPSLTQSSSSPSSSPTSVHQSNRCFLPGRMCFSADGERLTQHKQLFHHKNHHHRHHHHHYHHYLENHQHCQDHRHYHFHRHSNAYVHITKSDHWCSKNIDFHGSQKLTGNSSDSYPFHLFHSSCNRCCHGNMLHIQPRLQRPLNVAEGSSPPQRVEYIVQKTSLTAVENIAAENDQHDATSTIHRGTMLSSRDCDECFLSIEKMPRPSDVDRRYIDFRCSTDRLAEGDKSFSISPPPPSWSSSSSTKRSSSSSVTTNTRFTLTGLLLLLIVHMSFLPKTAHGQSAVSAACPTQCFCNNVGKIVYCSRKGLKAIPPALSPDTYELNLSNNFFQSTELHPSNFSSLRQLKYLYLSDCGIEKIRLGTFAGLGNLLFLDLSNNRLKYLAEETFAGLKLQHLFLNGNRQLQLGQGSFVGLQTQGLYLQDCSLSEIQPIVLDPLKSSLRYLGLNGNELVKIDERLLDIFNRLDHLRLGSNPLHCNCESLWLKEFFDKRGVNNNNENSSPSCLTPPSMKGLFFSNFTANDMRCTPPVFGDIEATFFKASGRLKCSARGDPKPTIYWTDPSGIVSKFPPSTDNDLMTTEALLQLKFEQSRNVISEGWSNFSNDQKRRSKKAKTTARSRNHDITNLDGKTHDRDPIFGTFLCMASNMAGNVTLTVNVSWPISETSDSKDVVLSPAQNKPFYESGDSEGKDSDFEVVNQFDNLSATGHDSPKQPGDQILNEEMALPSDDFSGSRSEDHRLYSVFEMACAVVGTFLATLVVCLLALALFIMKNRDKAPSKAQNGSGKAPSAPPLPHPYSHHLLGSTNALNHHQQQQLALQQQRSLLQQQLLDNSSGVIDSDGSHLYAETTSPLFPSGTYAATPLDQQLTGGFDFRSYQLQHGGLITTPTIQMPSETLSSLRERERHHPYIHPHIQTQPYPSYQGTVDRQNVKNEQFYPNGAENRICASYSER